MKKRVNKSDPESIAFDACIKYGEIIAKSFLNENEITSYEADVIHEFLRPFSLAVAKNALETKSEDSDDAVIEGMLKMLTILTAASKYIRDNVPEEESEEVTAEFHCGKFKNKEDLKKFLEDLMEE